MYTTNVRVEKLYIYYCNELKSWKVGKLGLKLCLYYFVITQENFSIGFFIAYSPFHELIIYCFAMNCQ